MKITEHEMLITLASMALKMDDLTGHDVIEALRELGYGDVLEEARKLETLPKPRELQVREPVRWFSERMEEKLQKNDHKSHWSNCDFPYLDKRLDEEIQELKTARSLLYPVTAETVQAVISEAADVANFAFMIADNARSKQNRE